MKQRSEGGELFATRMIGGGMDLGSNQRAMQLGGGLKQPVLEAPLDSEAAHVLLIVLCSCSKLGKPVLERKPSGHLLVGCF